jgi:hypothetical protein
LAGLWNVFDNRAGWVARLERTSGSAAIGPRDTFSNWRAQTTEAHFPDIGPGTRFGPSEQAEFPHGQRRTTGSLVAALATKAGLLVMPGDCESRQPPDIRASVLTVVPVTIGPRTHGVADGYRLESPAHEYATIATRSRAD